LLLYLPPHFPETNINSLKADIKMWLRMKLYINYICGAIEPLWRNAS